MTLGRIIRRKPLLAVCTLTGLVEATTTVGIHLLTSQRADMLGHVPLAIVYHRRGFVPGTAVGGGRPTRESAERFWLEFVAHLMQVDVLIAEGQRFPPIADGHPLHPQYPDVEGTGSWDVGNGQHEMVESLDVRRVHLLDNDDRTTLRSRSACHPRRTLCRGSARGQACPRSCGSQRVVCIVAQPDGSPGSGSRGGI